MVTKLNIPSPSSVQPTPNPDLTYRLYAKDGRLIRQLGTAQAIFQFPAAFEEFIASGKNRIAMHDIPESLQADVLSALVEAGWYTKVQHFADPDIIVAVPYTMMGVHSIPYLSWSRKPFPPTIEERVWKWLKSWFK